MPALLPIVLMLTTALMFAACAENTEQVRQTPAPGVALPESDQPIETSMTFAELRADPGKYVGRPVRLGGAVLSAKRTKDHTEVEILELPIDAANIPASDRLRSGGRFLAVQDTFLDPATVPAGTLVTVVGVVKGLVTRPLDDSEYAYPVIEISHLTDWTAVMNRGPGGTNWVALRREYLSPGIQTVYFDPDRIKRDGNVVTVWQLIDYKMMQGTGAVINPFALGGIYRYQLVPHGFFSTTTQKQFDCAKKRVRLLAFTEFSHHMGTGKRNNGLVDQEKWLPIEPDTVHHALWEMVCGAPAQPG